MTSAYVPTPEFTDTQLVVADGDAANFATFNLGPEKAFNRLAMLRAATDGLLVWGHKARVATGGLATGNTGVYVPPIEALSLLDGTTWVAKSLATETQLSTVTHFAGGTLSADTWYYVYAYIATGALALQISADAPEAGLIWKSGAVGTHRYLFCFHTDSAGVALPMRMSRGRYLYRFSAITSTELRALNTTTEVTATDVILARGGTSGRELLPPHARVARVRLEVSVTGNHADDQTTATLFTKGDSSANSMRIDVYPTTTSSASRIDGELETNDSRTCQYTWQFGNTDAGDPSGTLNVYVLGFED